MKVSKSLSKTLPFLQIVSDLPIKYRRVILAHPKVGGDQHIFNALHEISHNALKFIKQKKNLSPAQISKLKPEVKHLKKFCNLKKRNCAKRRNQIVQRGAGFLPILIPTIVSLVSSLLSKS